MTVQPHPYLHSLHDVSFSYIFKSAYKTMIIGCKLATTEYGAETFFQSQLVSVRVEVDNACVCTCLF